jgi:hypothetical protein
MSPEPTSVAALSRTSDLFSNSLLFPREYSYNNKSMQSTTDKRTNISSSSYSFNNNPSTTLEAQDVRHIQRQRHGSNNANNRDRLSADVHVEHSSFNKEHDILIAAAGLNIAESENSNTGVCNISTNKQMVNCVLVYQYDYF